MTKRVSASKARAPAKKKPVSRAGAKTKPGAKAKPAPHAERFPGESPAYRKLRNQLLEAEIALRRQTEAVAALRRKLPAGGAVPQDYVFEEGAADLADNSGTRQVKLSELFGHPDASLVLYSFMYGPNMAKPCPMCTAMLDALNGTAPHATQRINLAVVASSPLERIRDWGEKSKVQGVRLQGKLKDALEELEKTMIREGLKRTGWNKSKLAKELGISRAGLIMKVEKYGLDKRRLLRSSE